MKHSGHTGAVMALSVLLTLLLVLPFTCTFNSEEELYGVQVCDTVDVTWEHPIREILETNCVYCHNADFQLNNNGVRHDTYAEELKLVNSGRLRGAVNHQPGYTPMPYQLPQLPECELLLINIWLDRGAPEK